MKKRLLTGALLLFVLLSASCTKEETPSPSSSFDVEGKKTLSFSSFDGSGSSFDISIDDESVVSVNWSRVYRDKDHESKRGSGYDVVFAFTGLKEGSTRAVISARSPIADNWDTEYEITVDTDLGVRVALLSTTEIDPHGSD